MLNKHLGELRDMVAQGSLAEVIRGDIKRFEKRLMIAYFVAYAAFISIAIASTVIDITQN